MAKLFQCDGMVSAFLAGLGVKAEARVKFNMSKLAVLGHNARDPLTKPFGKGLFELRTSHDGMIYRSMFCFRFGGIVFLNSFVKKTQKTPQSEIDLARSMMADLDSGAIGFGAVTIH